MAKYLALYDPKLTASTLRFFGLDLEPLSGALSSALWVELSGQLRQLLSSNQPDYQQMLTKADQSK